MRLFVPALLILLSGCAGYPLASAANLYASGDAAYAALPDALQSSEVELLYVTDRQPEGTTADDPRYGYRRSDSAAWGLARVHFGDDIDWPSLVTASTGAAGSGRS